MTTVLPDRNTRRHRLAAALAVVIVSAVAFFSSCLPPQADRPTAFTGNRNYAKRPQPKIRIPGLEARIHALINKERQKHGLSRLAWDDRLGRIAREHSRDMAKRNYFSHDSPEGHDFSYRYGKAGYTCTVEEIADGKILSIYTGGENIFQNNLYNSITTVNGVAYYDWNKEEEIAETTVQGWMNSPGHRKNILTPQWRREGIGIFVAPDDKVYITQNFC
jgi:uncharacterized protein YkwD